jgi:hypothetical protein
LSQKLTRTDLCPGNLGRKRRRTQLEATWGKHVASVPPLHLCGVTVTCARRDGARSKDRPFGSIWPCTALARLAPCCSYNARHRESAGGSHTTPQVKTKAPVSPIPRMHGSVVRCFVAAVSRQTHPRQPAAALNREGEPRAGQGVATGSRAPRACRAVTHHVVRFDSGLRCLPNWRSGLAIWLLSIHCGVHVCGLLCWDYGR